MTYRSRGLLDSARGQCCTVGIPLVCNGDPTTVVAAHANMTWLGKGKSEKAPDWAIAWACSACHTAIDQGSTLSAAERWEYWLHGHMRTMAALFDSGALQYVGRT